MDVDTPNLLKRCSSAPLINEATSTVATSPSINSTPRTTFCGILSNNLPRQRRSSYSSIYLTAPISTSASTNSCGRRLNTTRVNQIRQEESADANTREVAHEREVTSAMHIEQFCEVFTLDGLHSPTRIHNRFPPVSPSPTRRSEVYARSLSPVAIRPPVLTCKRKCDDADSPLSKRMCVNDRLTPSTPGTPGTPDSDSLECTFRPVSPRHIPMNESPSHSQHVQENHKIDNPS